jgi:hypothetical protein
VDRRDTENLEILWTTTNVGEIGVITHPRRKRR